jgi:hypothetical protein
VVVGIFNKVVNTIEALVIKTPIAKREAILVFTNSFWLLLILPQA